MSWLKKGISLVSKGLQYKLRIAFSLMSILPLLVCVYLFFVYSPYIAKVPFSNLQIILSMGVSFLVAIIGFLVAKGIVDPIVAISSEVKSIAKGEFNRTIAISGEDEIGELGDALNTLTKRIRDNMDELRNYGERTKEINFEINKRVVVLSGLLHISNLISQGEKIKEIFQVSIDKLAQIKDTAWLILVRKEQDLPFQICADFEISDDLREILLKEGLQKIFDSIIVNKNGWVIDRRNTSKESDIARDIFGTANGIFMPIFRHGKIVGFLGAGNGEDGFEYTNEDIELLSIFAKQIAIAIENDYLSGRLGKLEINDTLTGLYNKNFIVNRLDEEIRRAIIYQRPCAFLLISIDGYDEYLRSFGQLSSETVLKKIARVLEENSTEVNRIARYGDNDFAFVLPEKNKKQSISFAEELKKKIDLYFSQDGSKTKLTISGAISENPIDGSSAKELIEKAESLLVVAKKERNIIKA